MPLTLEEILALSDIGQKINFLKKGRKTELPDRCKLWDDWNPERHEIMAVSYTHLVVFLLCAHFRSV